MKNVRFWLFLGFLLPCSVYGAASSDFQNAAQLLSAARRGDTRTVQFLINSGADINYTDSTGLSLVCTAVMNNDKRAIQILQMYGADASECDKQIKQYRQKSKVATSGEEYGFFSGLSSSHILALSAVGVAAVIGGVALLTKVFDSENNNSSSSSGGSHGGGNNGGSGGTTADPLFAQSLPYGPACSNGTCPTSFTNWEDDNSVHERDFNFMSKYGFNYLMVSRAYNAFVRGYLGMDTIRLSNDKSPYKLSDLPYPALSLPDGGQPLNVALITGSGVNAIGSAYNKSIPWVDFTQIANVISVCGTYGDSEACTKALEKATKISYKYYNYSLNDSGDLTENNKGFDLSGTGSVFGIATDADTKLAKIVAGWEHEDTSANPVGDYYGFIPNGQLSVYKTGNGKVWADPASVLVGTYTPNKLDVNDKISLFGKVLTIVSAEKDEVADGTVFTATSSSVVNGTTVNYTYHGYIIGNSLYIDSNADDNINQMYTMSDGHLSLTKEISSSAVADYKNYTAIYDAITRQSSGQYVSHVVANLSVPESAVELDYVDVMGAKALCDSRATNAAKQSVFIDKTNGLFNIFYNLDTSDDSAGTPASYADEAFTALGNYQQQILVNPAGWSRYGAGNGGSIVPQLATFENFIPVVYPNLQNLFMTVVAVAPAGEKGTANQTIDGYSASKVGKLGLAAWSDSNDSSARYTSRICGLTGTGNDGAMNPWCFAAPGRTNLDATAAMAGSIALVRSAFDYMTPQEIFLLLALTADGPYLGKNPETGNVWSASDSTSAKESALIAYLKERYILPSGLNINDDSYLDTFKQTFGYGMINLERATRPGTNLYFYSGTNITSSSGNAYWGNALKAGTSRASSVFSLAGPRSITASFYDVLESADGSVSLPRVWKNTFALDSVKDKHGLYMGDVLGEFNVDSTNAQTNQVGDFTVDMAMSQRAYNDNLNGLDNMRIAWTNEKFDLATDYQRHLTDGESRFDGRANGVLGLVSNTISANTMFKNGHFGFGGRAFVGAITDENLLDTDPVVASQFEPGRLGLAKGGSFDAKYGDDEFGLNMSFGVMHEDNTVLGMVNDGLFAMNNSDTKYIDAFATYKPFDNVKLSLRGTFATTRVDKQSEFISNLSDIKSNAFAFGTDIGGFSFTFALPLSVTDGHMEYGYADFEVVENNGKYEIAVNNPHMEHIDLSAHKRELRFSTSYKRALGEFTDAGVGLIYRVHPNNIDTFGNESVLMFKIHHRLGI